MTAARSRAALLAASLAALACGRGRDPVTGVRRYLDVVTAAYRFDDPSTSRT